MKCIVQAAGAALLFNAASPVLAQKGEAAPPEVFNRVVECQAITDSTSRLTCYDAAVAALAAARVAEEVVVVSREQVRETRRGLFGLTLPRIRLFGSGDSETEEQEFKELTSTISSVGQSRRGYVFTLPDGAVWEQTDNVYLGDLRAGQTVVIKRAALGSYFASVGGGRSARVKRVK